MNKTPDGPHTPRGREHPWDDPDRDFPIIDTVYDHSGRPRRFRSVIDPESTPFALRATEEPAREHGYTFEAIDATSPYVALGALRRKMRRALATRHLVPSEHPGESTILQDRLVGHIDRSPRDDSLLFVVDGIPLTLEDIGRIASIHEGY